MGAERTNGCPPERVAATSGYVSLEEAAYELGAAYNTLRGAVEYYAQHAAGFGADDRNGEHARDSLAKADDFLRRHREHMRE